MPSQRETRVKPVTLLAISGVNQRVNRTELNPQEWSDLQGVFPEFAGLQSRLWGKRLLKKYASSIYGIHQFWTPQGYGGGLYQFTGTLDFGTWLTPISVFDLTPLDLGIDLGGYTLDDFGNTGPNFDWGPQSACVLSFLEGGTDHSSCAPAPTNISTPDDSNGGPAGQGKKCAYEVVVDDRELAIYTLSQVSGNISGTVQISFTDNCRNPADGQNPPCVAFPPLPVPLQAAPAITFAFQTVNGVLSASTSLSSFAAFNPPTNGICNSATTCDQTNVVSANKLTLDLSPLLLETFNSCNLILTRTPGGEVEIPLTPGMAPITLTATDFLVMGAAVPNANVGFDQSGSVTGHLLRLRSNKRVCA